MGAFQYSSKNNPTPTLPLNISTRFREAFETLNTDKWNIYQDTGDIIRVDGNTASSSYLVVSKDPWSADTETSVASVTRFTMPIDASIGLHMSQRTIGQEFSVEFVSDDEPLSASTDTAISTMSQATTTLTVTTATPHGLRPGMRIGIRDAVDSRFNYPALVVATTPSTTQFTATAGPGGTIASLTAGPVTSGSVYVRSAMGRAQDGASMIFENTSATTASFYTRSAAGDALPSGTIAGAHGLTVGSTASLALVTGDNAIAWSPTTEYRYSAFVDGIQWYDLAVDAITSSTSRRKVTQVVPSTDKSYMIRFRARNLPSIARPIAKVVSATKSGTTTATIVCDRAHGLTIGDYVQVCGTRDQTNFANLTAATVVASVVNSTTFTVVWGSAVTATTYGGIVARVNGGQGLQGMTAQVAQSVSRTNNFVFLVGSAAWSGVSVGDYVDLAGCRDNTTGADIGLDGPYLVRSGVGTTTIVLEPIGTTPTGADVGSTNCGGILVKRTDLRVSFVRVLDFDRLRVEMLTRPDPASNAAPVVMLNNVTQSLASSLKGQIEGTTAIDAASPNPVGVGYRAANANPTAMSANADLVGALATMIGAAIVKPYALPEAGWNASLALTTTTAAAIQAAAAAGLKRHITAIQAINTGGATVDLIILDGATERWRLPLPVNVPVTFEFPTEISTTAATALNANLSAAGTVRLNAQGYTAP